MREPALQALDKRRRREVQRAPYLARCAAGEMPYKSLLREFWGPFEEEVQNIYEVNPMDVLNVITEQLAPLMLRPQACPVLSLRMRRRCQ